MPSKQSDRFAVLIDAENISARYVEHIFDEIARFGNATVKRIYGDWTLPDHGQWKLTLHSHAIMPVHQFRSTSGKNSTDSALIIDAMDLLYTGKFEGFCLVSSDSDFTRLACRIRESGLTVYGFGEAKTPLSFVQACDRFLRLENLGVAETSAAESKPSGLATAGAKIRPVKPSGDDKLSQAAIDGRASAGAGLPARPSKVGANPELVTLANAAYNSVTQKDGWASLGEFGARLLKLSPSFHCKKYGYKKLSEYVHALGLFEIKKLINYSKPDQAMSTAWEIKAKSVKQVRNPHPEKCCSAKPPK